MLVAGVLGVALVVLGVMLSTSSVKLVVKSDEESYPIGSSAHIELFLTYGPNLLQGPVEIPSMSYEVLISGPSGPVLATRGYVHTMEPIRISPNTTEKIGEFDWDLKDLSGNAVTPGTYVIAVSLLDYPLSGETKIQVLPVG